MSKAIENVKGNYTRNYGVDLFRIVAMFMIVNLHILKQRALKNIGFVNFIFKGIRNPPVSNQVLVDFLNSV